MKEKINIKTILTCGGCIIIGLALGYSLATSTLQKTSSYTVADEMVYFFDQPLYAADPATFTSLLYDYAKDEQHVYYDGRIVPAADPATFEVIGFLMAKDAQNVYTFDRTEPALNPDTIQFLGNFYSKQDDIIYFKGRSTTADSTTFKVIASDVAGQDKFGYYSNGLLVEQLPN